MKYNYLKQIKQLLKLPEAWNHPIRLWVFFHLLIFVLACLSAIVFNVHINTNLMGILPKGSSGVSKADSVFSAHSSKLAVILTAASDFDDAKEAAGLLYTAVEKSSAFESVNLYVDDTFFYKLRDYVFNYRYVLLDDTTIDLLNTGSTERISNEALQDIYGALTLSSLENISLDPFMLTERILKSYLKNAAVTSGAMAPYNGVLTAFYDNRWYILMRVSLPETGVSSSNNPVKYIYKFENEIKAVINGVNFYNSGVPFHSYESSSNAQKEISIITTISLIIILLLFLFTFKSIMPAFFTFFTALLSIATAFAGTLFIFRTMHILTLVFGTTLIGTSVDYSVHFFSHVKHRGYEARDAIIRGTAMSYISTCLCFIILILAPFTIVKQFAVFCIFGMTSSFITAIFFLPPLSDKFYRRGHRAHKENKIIVSKPRCYRFWGVKPVYLSLFFLAAVLVPLFIYYKNICIDNNIRNLYTMSPELLENEKIISKVLDYGSSSWYYIVKGTTQEELFFNENSLCKELEQYSNLDKLGSYISTTVLIPPILKQKNSYHSAAALLPLAKEQFESLGFYQNEAQYYLEDYESKKGTFVLPDSAYGTPLSNIIENFYLGKIDGTYYSVVMPLHPAADIKEFAALANDNVFFIDKARDISFQLDSITLKIIKLFIAAYIVIVILVKLFYHLKQAIKICLIPLIVCAVTLSVFAVLNKPLDFFAVCGFVLIFGLGLDYMFFITESGREDNCKSDKRSTLRAVILSYLTTALSFGALALSSFYPVHIFGLTVFSGLSAAFISSMIMRGNGKVIK